MRLVRCCSLVQVEVESGSGPACSSISDAAGVVEDERQAAAEPEGEGEVEGACIRENGYTGGLLSIPNLWRKITGFSATHSAGNSASAKVHWMTALSGMA